MCFIYYIFIGQYCSDSGEVLRLHKSNYLITYLTYNPNSISLSSEFPTIGNQNTREEKDVSALLSFGTVNVRQKYETLYFYVLHAHLLVLTLQSPYVLLTLLL